MEASFKVIAETDKDMIRLTMSGFFAESDIRRMRTALMVALTELHCAPNQHKTLCDIRRMQIQSQESVTLFQQLVGSEPVRSRLLAFVTSATLARLQARRLTSRQGVQFFSDMQEAADWLENS